MLPIISHNSVNVNPNIADYRSHVLFIRTSNDTNFNTASNNPPTSTIP